MRRLASCAINDEQTLLLLLLLWFKTNSIHDFVSYVYRNQRRRCRYLFRQCPRACDNFKCLCTGERGKSKHSGKVLHYKGSSFHRIVKGFVMQGGDYLFNDGRGGETIYGMKFGKDEVCIFIVSMRVILQPLTSMYPARKFYTIHLITRFKQKNSPWTVNSFEIDSNSHCRWVV